MSDINDGGPAFPLAPVVDPETGQFCGPHSTGMTLRDWFAGMALQGYLANTTTYHPAAAIETYRIADEMLTARGR